MAIWENPEALLIRAVLLNPQAPFVLDITPEHFRDPHFSQIWSQILVNQSPGWNYRESLFTDETITNLGGRTGRAFENLIEILRLKDPFIEYKGAVDYYADLVRATGKRILELKVKDLLDKPKKTAEEFAQIKTLLTQIETPFEESREPSPLEDKLAWLDSLQEPEKVIPTNYPSIDEFLGGFREASLYILAGRTGHGKTAVALNLAANLRDTKAVFYSLEMPLKYIHARLATIQTGIKTPITTQGRTREELENLGNAYAKDHLDQIKFAPIAEGGFTLDQLVADMKKRVRNNTCQIVFIDQLDNIRPDKTRYNSDTERLSAYSAKLRQAAKDLDIPIVLLAQLNREAEKSNTGEPRLIDLKHTGQLEQDAAVVMLIARKDLDSPNSELVFKIAKNRYGQTGKLFMNWKGEEQRIAEKPNYYSTRATQAEKF
jgi:replicative DNA helicase